MYCSKIIQHAPVYHLLSWLILFIHIPCVIVGLVRVGRSWYSPQPSMKDLLIYVSSTPCLKTVTCLHIPECLLDGVLATVLLKDEVWPRQGLRQEEHTRHGNVTRAGGYSAGGVNTISRSFSIYNCIKAADVLGCHCTEVMFLLTMAMPAF